MAIHFLPAFKVRHAWCIILSCSSPKGCRHWYAVFLRRFEQDRPVGIIMAWKVLHFLWFDSAARFCVAWDASMVALHRWNVLFLSPLFQHRHIIKSPIRYLGRLRQALIFHPRLAVHRIYKPHSICGIRCFTTSQWQRGLIQHPELKCPDRKLPSDWHPCDHQRMYLAPEYLYLSTSNF